MSHCDRPRKGYGVAVDLGLGEMRLCCGIAVCVLALAAPAAADAVPKLSVSLDALAGDDPIVASASSAAGYGRKPQRSAALHSTSSQPFVDAGGRPVPIVGFNVMPVWSDLPGRTWEQGRYDQIAAGGFTAVRFVLHWDDFEPVPGVFSATSLSTLDTAIARAKAAGLRVVLDCIHLWGPGGMEDVPPWARTGDSVTTVATNGGAFLRTLASRYRDEPAVAAYDLVNEPHRWPIDQNSVLRAYDQLIGQVRKVDPDKIVLIEPTYGDTSIAGALADFSNLKHRANVVYSLHDYFAGGDDDGYAVDGRQKGNYVWDGVTGYPIRDPAALEAHLRVHLDKLRAAGIPLWIGEFGIGAGVVGHDRWIADKIALFKRYGLGRAWWEYRTSDPFSATLPDGAWQPWISLLGP
jgi:hypothetical protein